MCDIWKRKCKIESNLKSSFVESQWDLPYFNLTVWIHCRKSYINYYWNFSSLSPVHTTLYKSEKESGIDSVTAVVIITVEVKHSLYTI